MHFFVCVHTYASQLILIRTLTTKLMCLETVENTILTSPQAFPSVQEPIKAGGSLGLLKGLLRSSMLWHTRGGWWQTAPASGLLQERSPMVVSAAGGPGLCHQVPVSGAQFYRKLAWTACAS